MNRILILVLLTIGISSCKMEPCLNKTYFMGTFENFIKSVKDENNNYSETDWNSKDDKMRGFVDDCYKAHKGAMTAEEKTTFWTKYVEYMLIRHQAGVIQAVNEEDQNSEIAIFDEISKSIENLDLEKLIKDTYGDDIEKSIDEIVDQVEDWAAELKKWLRTN